LEVKLSEYKTDFGIFKDILVVGIPASLEQFILSFVSILMNYWLTILSGTIAVAAYSATWRLVAMGMAPLIGIGMAALTVGGAAYGARNLENFKTALNYGVKLGLIFSVVVCIFLFVFAEPLSFIFSYSNNAAILSARVVDCLHILCFFLLLMPFGILAGNLFQSMGKGTISLTLTFLRAFILEVIFSGLFAFVFNLADIGIYIGMVVGMSIGCIFNYIYINFYLNRHKDYFTS
ncbi:MAG: MATE family efflux transporter, partial [Methanobrevibacter sp.]|nr:MATE family efflux transporter [Methanobrevibacter sp.]